MSFFAGNEDVWQSNEDQCWRYESSHLLTGPEQSWEELRQFLGNDRGEEIQIDRLGGSLKRLAQIPHLQLRIEVRRMVLVFPKSFCFHYAAELKATSKRPRFKPQLQNFR